MTEYNELEVGLLRHDADLYDVLVRFDRPGAINRVPIRGQVTIDLKKLRQVSPDAAQYGKDLSAALFADADVRREFESACAVTDAGESALRLRLFIDRSAAELHDVRWETLRDPRKEHSDRWLVTNARVLFSRFLGSDWRPIRLRGKGELRALVVIANPEDLAKVAYEPQGQRLAPIAVAEELKRAQAGLGKLLVDTLLSDPVNKTRVTLRAIDQKLRQRPGFDILYLVCHGALVQEKTEKRQEPYLWLEQEEGGSDVVAGINLVDRLYDLPHPPRLVVLASCDSAGKGAGAIPASSDEGALAALGPRLAETGVPAVLAMQGNVTMETVARFMPTFFKVLSEDGQVDEAVTAARSVVRDRPDAWAPALFLRLRSGCIWNRPGLHAGQGRKEFEGWDALIPRLRQGKCTPILGPGLAGFLLDPSRDLAVDWADAHRFPMSPYHREDLPQVVQYLRANRDHVFPYERLIEALYRQIVERYRGGLTSAQCEAAEEQPDADQLDDLVKAVAEKVWLADPTEPHLLLARLPLPIYLTTNPDNLLKQALLKAGKVPQEQLCAWKPRQIPAPVPADQSMEPTVEKPLVYRLFGRLDEPDSLVLSEDDYFDYLIGTARNNDLIPSAIRKALARSVLMFLGFRMDDWNFRVLFRSILSVPGLQLQRYAHVAVQVNPEEGRFIDPERARRYLERYFHEYLGQTFTGAKISIFWGNERDFLNELRERWNRDAKAEDRI